MKNKETSRGEAIKSIAEELAFRDHLRKLAEQRKRKTKRRDKKCSTKSVRCVESLA